MLIIKKFSQIFTSIQIKPIMANELKYFLLKFAKDESTDYSRGGMNAKQVEILQDIIGRILDDQIMLYGIFKPTFRPALGHLISLLLQTFANHKLDSDTRLNCGIILCSVTDVKYQRFSCNFIAFVLPGILATSQKVLLGDFKLLKSLEIARCASKIITNVLTVTFTEVDDPLFETGNNRMAIEDERMQLLSFERNAEWMKMAKEKLIVQLSAMFSRLCSSDIPTIRSEAMEMVEKINAQRIFGDDFDAITLDVISLLYNDEFPRTKKLCEEITPKIRCKRDFMESYGIKKLTKCVKSLEKDVKNAADGGKYISNLINLLEIFGPELCSRLFASQDFAQHFMLSIVEIIAIVKNRQMITESHNEQTEADDATLFPLEYGLNMDQIVRLVQILIPLSNFEDLFDWLLDTFNSSCSMERRISIAILIYAMGKSKITMTSKIYQFVGDILAILRPLEAVLEEEVHDERIEDVLPINTEQSCLVTLLLNCLSQLNFDQFNPKQTSESLFEVLKWASSSNYTIRESAELCLMEFYKSSKSVDSANSTLSDFIFDNAQRIMFQVSMASHDFSQNPRFPLVIAECVARCANPQMYHEVRGPIDEVLMWLDYSDQQKTMLLLRALRNYSQALLKWFPNLVPTCSRQFRNESTDEFDEMEGKKKQKQNDPNYPLISNATTLLNRTKHYISSSSLPIQILVLDILDSSLQLVRNYDDNLLQMIHQNWHGLVRKFGEDDCCNKSNNRWQTMPPMSQSQLLVAAKAVKVVEQICILSKEFVHRKILEDFLPRVDALLNSFFKGPIKNNMGGVLKTTAIYKLQCAILESLPTIVKESCVTKEECIGALRNALSLYFNNEYQIADELKTKATLAFESLKRTDEHDLTHPK